MVNKQKEVSKKDTKTKKKVNTDKIKSEIREESEEDFEFPEEREEKVLKVKREKIEKEEPKKEVKKENKLFLNNVKLGFRDIITFITLALVLIDTIILCVIVSRTSGLKTFNNMKNDSSSDNGGKVIGKETNNNGEKANKDYDTSKMVKINAQKFEQLLNDKDLSLVFTGSINCGHCHNFIKVVNRTLKEKKYKIYYLEMPIEESQIKAFKEKDAKFEDTLGYTPMVFAVKAGKVIDVNKGSTSYETYVKFLKNNKIW